MRDAIVYGYEWNGGVGPVERIAVALGCAGARVLHTASGVSVFKRPDTSLRQIGPNLHTFKPQVFASKLNRFPFLARAQGSWIARQMLERARGLGLEKPLFLYSHPGPLLGSICEAMRQQGCGLAFLPTDYVEGLAPAYVGQSDLTLVFSRPLYHRMRARWGEKIRYGFFAVDLSPFRNLRHDPEAGPPVLAGIPRPRLGYGGAYGGEFLNTRVLCELLERRPDWSFVSFGSPRVSAAGAKPAVPLPNAHLIPWQDPQGFARCVASFDVGFMPYDCSNAVLFNNPPMKLWDYFALGMPVVATPMIHLWDYEGLVYLGETARELEAAVEKALGEPGDSPLRDQRRAEAEKHSIEALGRLLERMLG